MKRLLLPRFMLLLVLSGCMLFTPFAGHSQGAAPSEHLVFSFPSDAVLKMHKIKIVQTAFATYYEMNSFAGGYAGLQHTPDSSKGSSHIMISSLWDPNTAGGIYSSVDYKAPNTYTGRFGGEGDGYQSINPYNWVLNRWYNMVIRSWKSGGRLHIATFINDLTANTWFHTVTLSVPQTSQYLGSGNDAFLENWTGSGSDRDGRYIRKAFFKDCWNLNTSGVWQKHSSRYFSANSGDQVRNGIYDRSFNAGYDATEDAYFMQHGGSTTPDPAFGVSGRTLTLPVQTNQGSAPVVTTGAVTAASAYYSNGQTFVNWSIDASQSPQLSAKVQITDADNNVVKSFEDTLPQRRIDTLTGILPSGSYTAHVTIRDIFNNVSSEATATFSVNDAVGTGWYRLKNVSSGKYLAVEDSSVNNSAAIVQYSNTGSYTMEWRFDAQGGAYVLINRKSGKAIDLPGSSQASGTVPIQYVITNNINQQWNLVSVSGSTYLIQSNMSNHYVMDDPASSSAEGEQIILYNATGGSNQQWVLEAVDDDDQLSVPVNMVSLTAKAQGRQALLQWATVTESNSKEFIISRSTDGVHFKEIGKVAGAGNATIQKEYSFYDSNPGNGIVYYHVQLVNQDGSTRDIGIRQVNFSSAANIVNVYPNPAKDRLHIRFNAGIFQLLELLDTNGSVLQKQSLNNADTEKTLYLNSRPAGIYFIKLTGSQVVVNKIIKQ